MKIPEASANVGAYYGNEENGQWQPNGVIMDSGVGGGVVGSGDAGVRPVYPVHIPRGHVPAGYVMAGAYYPPAFGAPAPPPQPDDFADYMWMENEEEFDKQVMQQLEEEALMEQCIEAMLEDEQRERQHRPTNGHNQNYATSSNGALSLEETVSRSTLNPLAAEFVPSFLPAHKTCTEVKQTPSTEVSTEETQQKSDAAVDTTTEENNSKPEEEQEKTEVPEPTLAVCPEVSAEVIVPPTTLTGGKDAKKEVKAKGDAKKPAKTEVKSKTKPPQVVKAELKVQPKKKEVKTVKSESKVEEKIEDVPVPVDTPKTQPAPVADVPTSGFKPINYAAAAKANKPKPKPTTPTEKPPTTTPPTKTEKLRITEKLDKKDTKTKSDKITVQRKNSAK